MIYNIFIIWFSIAYGYSICLYRDMAEMADWSPPTRLDRLTLILHVMIMSSIGALMFPFIFLLNQLSNLYYLFNKK